MAKRTPPPTYEVPLVSKVKDLCDRRSWTMKEFVGECIKQNVCGIDTAKKIYEGSTNLQVSTLASLAVRVFKVPMNKVIDLAPDVLS